MKAVRAPGEIKERGLALWKTQNLLRAELRGEKPFPLLIPCVRPSAKDLLQDFARWKDFYAQLRAGAKNGYSVESIAIRHQKLGDQQIPARLCFETAEDFYGFIGKGRDYKRWTELVSRLLEAEPCLRPWIERSPLGVLERAADWEAALKTIAYFRSRPRPGLYARQLDIAGVDTKFIENHKGWLRELFDLALPPEAIDDSQTNLAAGGFERRFGLRFAEGMIRFRFLDPELIRRYRFADLTLPFSEFRAAELEARRVFITENKINGLSFPDVKDGLVIFGLGYGITALGDVGWLGGKEIFYWGDIDTHGFAILSRLREAFPAVRSFLMDRATLMGFRELWGTEPDEARWLQDLERLDPEERALFDDLRRDRLAPNLRFEQERVPFHWVEKNVAET